MEEKAGSRRETVKKIIKTITHPDPFKKHIKKELAVSEEKYKTAFEYTGTGMMILEDDMTISLVNQKILELTGYKKEEIEGKQKWTYLVSESDLKRMMGYHTTRRVEPDAAPTQYEFQYKHKSGALRDALITVSMVPGTKKSLISMVDIAERKAMEKELIESQRRFRETAELLPGIICEFDMDLRFTYVNKIGLSVFGYQPDDVGSGFVLASLVHADDRERALENIKRIIGGEQIRPQEYRLVHKDGTVRDYYATSSRIMKDGAIMGIRSCVLDLSERKRMERLLAESEERMRAMFAASPIGIAVFNDGGKAIDINASFRAMFGLDEAVSCNDLAFSLFEHVDDIKNSKSRLIKTGGMNFESKNDFRFVKNGGVYEVVYTGNRWLDWYVTPIGAHADTAEMFLVQVQDITERKRSEENRLTEANRLVEGLRKEIFRNARFHNMVSRSPDMQKIFDILPEVAQTPTTVLITGESGTGKELIARSIHELSERKQKPFLAVNCGALPENLMESELFGYKAGAFTDAKKDKPGKFALAGGGTIFLDEIGDISPAMQVKLLRVLQEKTFEPLGATNTVSADVRIITATNKNLPEMVKTGQFREDFYYRIKVLNISLPPLRSRKGDIPLLCEHFISLFNARYKKNIKELSGQALDLLLAHDYPGNIRELENILEHAFIFCKSDTIEPMHLPPEITSALTPCRDSDNQFAGIQNFKDLERVYLMNVLKEVGGSRLKAAAKLGIHKATLFRKIKSLGIQDV